MKRLYLRYHGYSFLLVFLVVLFGVAEGVLPEPDGFLFTMWVCLKQMRYYLVHSCICFDGIMMAMIVQGK